ncbi:MAG TPA: glycoside hydrolase family 88 protein [Candidatus Acidoferrales bacterium]|nr:glycoside hydrolase family 88 protein [Candidatus Acidoferrales bacterium]
MDSDLIDVESIARSLRRLAIHASVELPAKQPHWGDAILCDGMLAAADALGLDAPRVAAEKWFARKLATGPKLDGWFWFWAAEAMPALGLHARTGRAEYLDYARKILAAVETTAARTPDGAIVPHPPAMEVWVDVSYFTAPAMARLGALLGDRAKIEWAARQILTHYKHLVDPATGLLWHVAYVDKKSHSQCLWARGNSWFSIASADVLPILEQQGLREKFDAIESAVVRQLNAIVALQDASGLWHTVIDRPDSYLEASSAAAFACALGAALRDRYRGLDVARARSAYARALAAICAKINDDGEFTCVSQQTPPGDFDFYNSIELGTASYASGICMMALSDALAAAKPN